MSNIIADCGSQLKTLLLDNNDPRCLHGVIGSIAVSAALYEYCRLFCVQN